MKKVVSVLSVNPEVHVKFVKRVPGAPKVWGEVSIVRVRG